MSTDSNKPRRVVSARRMLALGASATVLGAAASAAPVTPTFHSQPSYSHQVAAEGEGTAVEAEGEGAAVESETPSVEGEGESEGGGSNAADEANRASTLVAISGLLTVAKELRDAGDPEANELIEEAAETAEHKLTEPLAGELYEAIEALEDAQGTEEFAALFDRLLAARAEATDAERLEALPAALRTAAEEYEEAVSDGKVENRKAYLEALGIYGGVRTEIETLAKSSEPVVVGVTDEMLAVLAETDVAFDSVSGDNIKSPDASLLFAAAARIEIAALKLR